MKQSVGVLNSVFLEKKGGLLGSVLLICGSSLGVGILPLPILTGHAGFFPTSVIFTLCCLFMTITALLFLESSLFFSDNKNFTSLAKKTLNKTGQFAVFFSFIFLFYSLTTAYLAKGGELVSLFYEKYTSVPIPNCSGSVLLALVSGTLIFLGPFIVDHINRLFMAGFLLTYFFLTFAGVQHFHVENVQRIDWNYSLFMIPFLITSFGYHNLLSSIREYLGNDKKKVLQAILISGSILLLVYNFWTFMFQGIIPYEGEFSITNSFMKGEIVTQPLTHLIRSPWIQLSAEYMAFFAIITSLLGVGLSIIDFLADMLKVEKSFKMRLVLCIVLFFPTLLFSQLIPGVFFKALELAGGVACMVVFGIIPACMSWVVRYRRDSSHGHFRQLVPGGKPMLILVMGLASSLIGYEIVKNLG